MLWFLPAGGYVYFMSEGCPRPLTLPPVLFLLDTWTCGCGSLNDLPRSA